MNTRAAIALLIFGFGLVSSANACRRNFENPNSSPYWCNYPLWVAKFASDSLIEKGSGIWMSNGVSADKPEVGKKISPNFLPFRKAVELADQEVSLFQDKEKRKFAFTYFGGKVTESGMCQDLIIVGVLAGSEWNSFGYTPENGRVNRLSKEHIVEPCSK